MLLVVVDPAMAYLKETQLHFCFVCKLCNHKCPRGMVRGCSGKDVPRLSKMLPGLGSIAGIALNPEPL